MKDFFKYLTAGTEDKSWGLYLNVAGTALVKPFSSYPSYKHPARYHFNRLEGRVLDEFQVNYISEGFGQLETEQGTYRIKPGTILIIRPQLWHRYSPERKTGWREYFVGFKGDIASHVLSQSIYAKSAPIIYCGHRPDFIDIYSKILDLVRGEPPGYHQICCGLMIQLLGHIVAYKKQQKFSGKQIEKVIQAVKLHIHQNYDSKIELSVLAKNHGIAYSHFRKMFKKYTGVSPHQYQLELRILKARELILSTDKSIKEISYQLGFSSIFYFSRFFKNRVGVSPSEFQSAASRKIQNH